MGPKKYFRLGCGVCAWIAIGCSSDAGTSPPGLGESSCDGFTFAELSRSDFHHACQVDANDEIETVRCKFDGADQPVALDASDTVTECYCNGYYFCRGAR